MCLHNKLYVQNTAEYTPDLQIKIFSSSFRIDSCFITSLVVYRNGPTIIYWGSYLNHPRWPCVIKVTRATQGPNESLCVRSVRSNPRHTAAPGYTHRSISFPTNVFSLSFNPFRIFQNLSRSSHTTTHPTPHFHLPKITYPYTQPKIYLHTDSLHYNNYNKVSSLVYLLMLDNNKLISPTQNLCKHYSKLN